MLSHVSNSCSGMQLHPSSGYAHLTIQCISEESPQEGQTENMVVVGWLIHHSR